MLLLHGADGLAALADDAGGVAAVHRELAAVLEASASGSGIAGGLRSCCSLPGRREGTYKASKNKCDKCVLGFETEARGKERRNWFEGKDTCQET